MRRVVGGGLILHNSQPDIGTPDISQYHHFNASSAVGLFEFCQPAKPCIDSVAGPVFCPDKSLIASRV